MYTFLVWLSVRLYPINVRTAEPIGPIFCGTSCDPREVLWMIDWICENLKIHEKNRKVFVCFCFTMYTTN